MKPCFSTVTPSAPPAVGRPSWLIHDRKGYSLPKNHTPSVLPLKSSGLVMPVSLRQVSIMPERLERLGDVDHRRTLFARGQCRWHPVDHHVSAAAGQNLLRVDVRAARHDGDFEAGILVDSPWPGPRSNRRTAPASPTSAEASRPRQKRRLELTRSAPAAAAASKYFFIVLSPPCFVPNSRLPPVRRMPKSHPALDKRQATRRMPNPPVLPRRFQPKPYPAPCGPLPLKCESPCRQSAFRKTPQQLRQSWPMSS